MDDALKLIVNEGLRWRSLQNNETDSPTPSPTLSPTGAPTVFSVGWDDFPIVGVLALIICIPIVILLALKLYLKATGRD